MGTNNTDKMMDYLNAYNAPHWMQFFEPGHTTNNHLRGWSTNQTLNNGGSVERFGTSWMYDLMVAAGQNAAGLRGANYNLRLTGSVDANHGATPFMHASHDLGMSFDLGIGDDYISPDVKNTQGQVTQRGNQSNANEPSTVTANAVGWSIANARAQMAVSNGVVETDHYLLPLPANSPPGTQPQNLNFNRQSSALGAFLSFYSATRNDDTVAGSRGALTFVNGNTAANANKIRSALFGSGNANDGMVAGVLVGGRGTAQNPLRNIHQVLSNLGFADNVYASNTSTFLNTESAHQNHYHVYLRPPRADGIGDRSLMATPITSETDAMLPDVPNLPPQDLSGIVTQIAAANKLENCRVVMNEKPAPAFNSFFPVPLKVAKQLGLNSPQSVAPFGFFETILLAPPKHGVVAPFGGDSVQSSSPHWIYEVNEAGYSGWDQAVFLIKAKGRSFQSVVTFRSVQGIDDRDEAEFQAMYQRLCTPDKTGMSLNGSVWADYSNSYPAEISQWFRSALFSSVLSMMSGVTYSFSNLPGTTIGTTTGQGPTAQITLDTDAAGHGWYVDETPLDNTDDYLPTSDPTLWKAKAGSAADGKMDLLSVLLHEYGHALGLEHSGDARDFMGASLQAGERRLPSAQELQIMAKLVAQLKEEPTAGDQPDVPTLPHDLPLDLPLNSLALAGLLSARRRSGTDAGTETDNAVLTEPHPDPPTKTGTN